MKLFKKTWPGAGSFGLHREERRDGYGHPGAGSAADGEGTGQGQDPGGKSSGGEAGGQ